MTLRFGLILAALGAFIIFVWFALHWREEGIRQKARADSAELQSHVDTGTAAIGDRVGSERVIIIQQSEEKASAVEAIPSDDIPADVLSGWRGGVRYASGSRANPDGSAELPGAVSEPEP